MDDSFNELIYFPVQAFPETPSAKRRKVLGESHEG